MYQEQGFYFQSESSKNKRAFRHPTNFKGHPNLFVSAKSILPRQTSRKSVFVRKWFYFLPFFFLVLFFRLFLQLFSPLHVEWLVLLFVGKELVEGLSQDFFDAACAKLVGVTRFQKMRRGQNGNRHRLSTRICTGLRHPQTSSISRRGKRTWSWTKLVHEWGVFWQLL